MIPENELRQLFKNRSDCYADTWESKRGFMEEGKVIQAMTEDRFIETVNEALRKHSVMQAEGSAGAEVAAVASSAVGSQTSAWQCPNCRCYTTNENYEKYCSQSCFDGA